MRLRMVLAIIMVWLGGMGTVVTALQYFPSYLTPPPPACPAPDVPVYEAAPFHWSGRSGGTGGHGHDGGNGGHQSL